MLPCPFTSNHDPRNNVLYRLVLYGNPLNTEQEREREERKQKHKKAKKKQILQPVAGESEDEGEEEEDRALIRWEMEW